MIVKIHHVKTKGSKEKKVWDHTVLHTIVTMQEEIAVFQCFAFLEMNHDVENGFKIVEEQIFRRFQPSSCTIMNCVQNTLKNHNSETKKSETD